MDDDARTYQPTDEEVCDQLLDWRDGEPRHLGERPDGLCCPDFSCCQPTLLQPPEVRVAYVAADQQGRERYLATFLGAMLADLGAGSRVHIAGKGEPE